MAKREQITPVGTSEAILSIILNASGQLNDAQQAEQQRIWEWVQKKLMTGKLALDLKENADGTQGIKPTAANVKKVNGLMNQLNIAADPDRIKDAVKTYNEAAQQASQTNQKYYKSEFASYVFKPAFNIPIQNLIQTTLDSTTRGQYTSAFVNPIRQTIFKHVQTGANFQTLVDGLQYQITGISPNTSKTWAIRNGLLENYHQLKRLTRDTMFQTLANETDAVANALGPDTAWYQYIGGLVEDSRKECIRRHKLRYFSRKEVDSWKKLTKKQWPEQIPNIEPIVQRGGWNCLHDLRIISVRRVPEERLKQSLAQGFIDQKQFDEAMKAKGFDTTAKPAPPVAKPAPPVAKPAPPVAKPAPPVAKPAPPVSKAASVPEIDRVIDLKSELGTKSKNIPKGSNAKMEALFKKHGIASEFGEVRKGRRVEKDSFDGLPISSIEKMINTAIYVQKKYGYVVRIDPSDIDKIKKAGNGTASIAQFDGSSTQKRFTFGRSTHRNANMSANGAGVFISSKYAKGSFIEQIGRNNFEDARKLAAVEAKKAMVTWQELQDELTKRKENGEKLAVWERKNLFNSKGAIRQLQKTIDNANKPIEAGDFQQWSLSRDSRVLNEDATNAIRNTTLHEFGHVLHYQAFGMSGRNVNEQPYRTTAAVLSDSDAYRMRRRWTDLYSKYGDSEWTRTYSKYASKMEVELFAETFLMYDRRPDLLPAEIRDFMDELFEIQRKSIQYFKENEIKYN
jgi:hypothetical protein